MTASMALIATGLAVIAALDGAFAGFRSSAGRTGLIDHRSADRLAARRGVLLTCVLLAPVAGAAAAEAWLGDAAALTRAGEAMLAVYVPYAVIALLALGCYSVLGWRQRYLATAVILGPFTLARPAVALLGGAAGAYAGRNVFVAACAGLAAVAVLAVQPVADRCWYGRRWQRVSWPCAGCLPSPASRTRAASGS